MIAPPPPNDVTLRYQEANGLDLRRPAGRVRDAVRAHAQLLATPNQSALGQRALPRARAANQPRWKIPVLGSVLLASLTGLLVLQFDRSTPQERELVRGRSAPIAAAPQPTFSPPSPSATAQQATVAEPWAAATAPKTSAATGKPPVAGIAQRAAATPRSAGTPGIVDAVTAAGSDTAARTESLESAGMPGQGAAVAQAVTAAPAAAALPAPAPSRQAAPAAVAEAQTMQGNGAARLVDSAAREKSNVTALLAPRDRTQGTLAPDLAAALQDAARTGRIQQLDRLIALGAPLDVPDPAGRTALMLATIHGQTEAVRRLLSAGANRALLDRDGVSTLEHARRLGLDRIAGLIEAGP